MISRPDLLDTQSQALMSCVGHGDREGLLDYLLFLSADPDQMNLLLSAPKNRTLLHAACSFNFSDCLQILLESGFSLEATDEKGNTPLHWAAHFGADRCVDVLLERKPNLEAKNHQSQSPLYMAIHGGRESTSRQLIEAGAPIHETDQQGNTLLHLVALKGPVSLVQYLTIQGLDSSSQNLIGKRPADYAKRSDVALFLKLHQEKKELDESTPGSFPSRHPLSL